MTPLPCALPDLCVSGASGWIGRALAAEVRRRDGRVIELNVREGAEQIAGRIPRGSVVVHLAAIAHRSGSAVSESSYLQINRDLAVGLGQTARAAGARRFVFVSTAAVMGRTSLRPWVEADPPEPPDPYSRAKWQAEQALRALHDPDHFDVRILRPPLVWGPGARANFDALLRAAASGLPLPLGRACAPRSMVYLGNVVDALIHLSTADAGSGGVFFVRDDEDRSVASWVTTVQEALGRPPRLVSVPEPIVRWATSVLRRPGHYERLFLPFQVDDSALRATGWCSPESFDQALSVTLESIRAR